MRNETNLKKGKLVLLLTAMEAFLVIGYTFILRLFFHMFQLEYMLNFCTLQPIKNYDVFKNKIQLWEILKYFLKSILAIKSIKIFLEAKL